MASKKVTNIGGPAQLSPRSWAFTITFEVSPRPDGQDVLVVFTQRDAIPSIGGLASSTNMQPCVQIRIKHPHEETYYWESTVPIHAKEVVLPDEYGGLIIRWKLGQTGGDTHNQGGVEWSHSKAPSSVPDVAGAILGARVWNIRRYHSGFFYDPPIVPDFPDGTLFSIGVPDHWRPGEVKVAGCVHGRYHGVSYKPGGTPVDELWPREELDEEGDPIVIPDPRCDCGLWGLFDMADLIYTRSAAAPGSVWGLIEGYGVVVEGDIGFRAEKARIVAFMDPPVDFSMRSIADAPKRFHRLTRYAKAWNVPIISRQEAQSRLVAARPPGADE